MSIAMREEAEKLGTGVGTEGEYEHRGQRAKNQEMISNF
jgi:hypothetical protein